MDAYLANPGSLTMPKFQLGDYVESFGVRVPRRYDSLEEAVGSGRPFIIRSEHPMEYAGPSGILKSLKVTPERLQWAREYAADEGLTLASADLRYRQDDELSATRWSPASPFDATGALLFQLPELSTKDFLEQYRHWMSRHYLPKQYCSLFAMDVNKFVREASVSFWELLDGDNHTMIADTSVQGRYHLITRRAGEKIPWRYTTVDEDKPSLEVPVPLFADVKRSLSGLVGFYETVRRLPNFDASHCPILELQSSADDNHFLQYHRGRDFSPTTFALERQADAIETEARWVRGATPASGLRVDAALFYPSWNLLPVEEASFDYEDDHKPFIEVMTRRRSVQFISDSLLGMMGSVAVGHLQTSKLFKPQVSILVPKNLLSSDDENRAFESLRKSGVSLRIPFHVVSDGKRALVSRLE